jgi:ABC-2 type transport system ATP-binding protein
VIEVRGLTRYYAARPVVNGVSFTLRRGTVTGYLGPNGSGKSTTVKMLVGLVAPTSGEILCDGRPVSADPVGFRQNLGYVPEEPALYTHLTGEEYLVLVGRLRGMDDARLRRRIDALLSLFGLDGDRHAFLAAYSKGIRQKVLISAALLHDPELLVFDEPLSGLDVTSALVFRHLLIALAEDGKAILYSSHELAEVERTCSDVLILHAGTVVAHDSVTRLKELSASPDLEHVFTRLTLQEDPAETARAIRAAARL